MAAKCTGSFFKLEVEKCDHTSPSIGTELLQEIKAIIDFSSGDHIQASRLREQLVNLPKSKWATLNYGKPISDKWLSSQLRPYKVHSVKMAKYNAYLVDELQDAFARYLRLSSKSSKPPAN